MSEERAGHIPWRIQGPVYAAGMFSNGMADVVSVIVPLWVVMIEPSPFLVGIALGSRNLLPVLLSIHGGAMMDRIGPRKVMLFFGAMGTVVPFLFPFMPWIWAVIMLQMLGGLAAAMGWIGTQTMIGLSMRGETVYAGRTTFFARLGATLGPPIMGASWDLFGPTGAFIALGIWASGALIAALLLPPPAPGSLPEQTGPMRVRDVMPRLSDYIDSLKLVAVPAIAAVVLVAMIRHSSNGIHSSFYVVYLESIGISGTAIGTLFAAANILGGAGSLGVGGMTRWIRSYWLLLIAVFGCVACIAITPALGFYWLILVFAALRGASIGISQPLLISVTLQAVEPPDKGKAIAVRTTANRFATLVIPIVMGAVIEVAGIVMSFYLVGGVLLLMLAGVAVFIWRSRAFD